MNGTTAVPAFQNEDRGYGPPPSPCSPQVRAALNACRGSRVNIKTHNGKDKTGVRVLSVTRMYLVLDIAQNIDEYPGYIEWKLPLELVELVMFGEVEHKTQGISICLIKI